MINRSGRLPAAGWSLDVRSDSPESIAVSIAERVLSYMTYMIALVSQPQVSGVCPRRQCKLLIYKSLLFTRNLYFTFLEPENNRYLVASVWDNCLKVAGSNSAICMTDTVCMSFHHR